MGDGSGVFRLDNLVSAMIGGVVGGLVVWGLVKKSGATASADPATASATANQESAPPSPAAPPRGDVVGERLRKLEIGMRSVQARQAEQTKVDVYEEAGDDDASAKRITLSAADPKFQNAVRAVIDKTRWEEEQHEQDKREERRDRRIAAQVDELSKELDLSDEQADQVEIVLQGRAETFRELRESDERPVTRQEWRTKFKEIQADTREKLAAFLDDGQLEAYDKFQEQQGFGPWGGRPRPPRGKP